MEAKAESKASIWLLEISLTKEPMSTILQITWNGFI